MAVVRTIRNEIKTVSLNLSDLNKGEYLLYKLKACEGKGIFSIVDEKSRVLMKSPDAFDSQQDYLLKWPRTLADIPPENDIIYTLVMFFNKSKKYSYIVEHHKANGSFPVILKDIDFESENPADSDYNTLRVLFK